MAKNKLKELLVEKPTVEAIEPISEDLTEDTNEVDTITDVPVESVEVENKYPGHSTRAYRS